MQCLLNNVVNIMKLFGIWILMTFAIYYVIALVVRSRNPVGCLLLGAILSLGITLTFFL